MRNEPNPFDDIRDDLRLAREHNNIDFVYLAIDKLTTEVERLSNEQEA